MAHPLHELTELFSDMPGIGPRQARRIVQFLLRTNPSYKQKLVRGIETISDNVSQCALCYRFDEMGNKKVCAICEDESRNKLLMVVEKDIDVESVEGAGVHAGKYFVLGSLIPLAKGRKSTTEPRTKQLLERISKNGDISEVVLAFATTPEGDHTTREIKKLFNDQYTNITVSVLGRGLSLGAEIEYADQETLKNAFDGRH